MNEKIQQAQGAERKKAMAKNNGYKVVIGDDFWMVDESGYKAVKSLLQCVAGKASKAKKDESKKSETKVKDSYDWNQHYQLDGRQLTILYKDMPNGYDWEIASFNKRSKMIKSRAVKDFGAVWTGNYDEKIWTWKFRDDKSLKAFQKDANEGFPYKKA